MHFLKQIFGYTALHCAIDRGEAFNLGECLPELPCQNRSCPAANFYFWPLFLATRVGVGGGGVEKCFP